MGSSFLLLCPPLPSLRSLSTSRDPWQVRPSPPSAFLMAAVSAAADWRLTSQRGASRCSPLAFCASPSPPPPVPPACDGGVTAAAVTPATQFPFRWRVPLRATCHPPPRPPSPWSSLPAGAPTPARCRRVARPFWRISLLLCGGRRVGGESPSLVGLAGKGGGESESPTAATARRSGGAGRRGPRRRWSCRTLRVGGVVKRRWGSPRVVDGLPLTAAATGRGRVGDPVEWLWLAGRQR